MINGTSLVRIERVVLSSICNGFEWGTTNIGSMLDDAVNFDRLKAFTLKYFSKLTLHYAFF